MLDVLEEPSVRARVPALSVEQYHRMADLNLIAANTELIRGALIQKMPKSPLHSSIVLLLTRHLISLEHHGFTLRSEQPLTLADSEPEPDIALVKGTVGDHVTQHPSTAELVIEVAVSSAVLDRLKLALYAEAGVREYWIILADTRRVERYSEPMGSAYGKLESCTLDGSLESTVFPGLRLPPAGLPPS